MSNENEIGIIISAQDLTGDGMASAKQKLTELNSANKDMSTISDESGKAFKGMGFAMHEMTRELGFTGPAARFVSHEVADMAMSLGTAGNIIGAVTIASIAAYKIYEHVADSERLKAEAIDKSIKSLEGEVTALYANTEKNDAVTKATYNLLTAKKALLVLDYTKQIELETAALTKQVDSYNTDVKRLAQPSNPFVGLTQSEYIELTKREALELQITRDTLEKKKALLAQYSSTTPTYGNYSGDDTKALAAEEQKMKELSAAYKAYYDTRDAEQKKFEADYFDAQDKMIDKQKETDNAMAVSAKNMKIDWDNEKLRLKEEEQMKKTLYDMEVSLAGNMLLLAVQSGKQGAEAQKRDAQYAIIVNTAVGVTKALAEYTYPYSLYVGALVAAAGAVEYSKVSSASYGSSSSISSSSSGSTSSSPSGGYKYFNYEQSTYGTGWKPGSDTSGSGVTLVVNGDVIASDANSVQKWVTKAVVTSMQNNEYGMNAAVKKYAKA